MRTRDLLVAFDEALMKITDETGKTMYKYWLENYAEPHIKKWLEEHNYNVDTCRSSEYIEYITNHFIDWVTNK